MKKDYSVIVFDLGNTLIRFDHSISANKIANLFRADSKKIYDIFFDSSLTRAFEKGEISPREFYARATELLGFELSYRDFVPIWNDIFWEDEAACDIARQVKKTHKVFLLSNINRLHFEHIWHKFEIMKIFDEMILSFIVGAIKPEAMIYEAVIRKAGGNRRDILYIDDREDLVKEAISLGIDSIRYEDAEHLKLALRAAGLTSV